MNTTNAMPSSRRCSKQPWITSLQSEQIEGGNILQLNWIEAGSVDASERVRWHYGLTDHKYIFEDTSSL